MTQFRSLWAGLILALTLTATAAAAVTLNRGNGAEPDTLDPHKASGQWENNIIGDMFLGLMTENAKGEPVPGAAVSYTVSEDGLTWTWTLREGALWSDGKPVTADDFVFAMQRINTPATGAQYSSLTNVIKNAKKFREGTAQASELGIRAVNALTLEMTLEHPAPYMPSLVTHYTFFPVPKHAVEALGEDWTKPGQYVSNGAFVLINWTPNDHVLLRKNSNFYDASNVKIDEIKYYAQDDQNANLKRFRAGELDVMAGIPAQQIVDVKTQLPQETRLYPFILTNYLSINMTRPPFNDLRVRQALAMAIDRETIVSRILKRGERVADTLTPDVMPGFTRTARLKWFDMPLPERLAEAKRLLAEAGFNEQNPLRFTFLHSTATDGRRLATVYQDMWRKAGVEVTLQGSETRVMYNMIRKQDYEVAQAGWIADFPDAINYLYLARASSGEMNYSKFNNPEFERITDASDMEKDATVRAALLNQAEQIVLDELPMIPTYFGVSTNLVAQYVKGWEDNAVNLHRSRFLSIEGARTAPGATAAAPAADPASAAGNAQPWYWWLTAAWNWFLGLLCSWFGVACPAA